MGSSRRGLVDSNSYYNSPATTRAGQPADVEFAGPPSDVRDFLATEQ